MHSPEELTQRFRARGLKVTPQRQAVFRALFNNDMHPTADAVYAQVAEQMPTISLRTVYQTLNDLTEMGEILHLELGTGSARFDANVEQHHHHLVCEGCGLVRDVDADLSSLQFSSVLPTGFRVSETEILLRGRCESC
ncbi:MAG: Fur family transcriptional regulator [Microthrixaceae bacterium]